MERRNFIRSMLAGLALAPLAKCLIDIPAAVPPKLVSMPGTDIGRPYRVFSNTDLNEDLRRMPSYEGTYWRDALGLAKPPRVDVSKLLADAPPYRGLELFKARAERNARGAASSFAEWDRRVGRALLS